MTYQPQDPPPPFPRWGWTTHRMTLLICQRCRYVLHLYDSNSIWDFD